MLRSVAACEVIRLPRTRWGNLPIFPVLIRADTSNMTEHTASSAGNVVPQSERPAGARVFRTSTLVVAAAVSTAVSVSIYFVLAILAGIFSFLEKFVSALSGSAPQPDPKPPYGPQGLLLILSPWLVFASVAALRWMWCLRRERRQVCAVESCPRL